MSRVSMHMKTINREPLAILARQYLERFWRRSGFIQDYTDFLLTEVDPVLSRKRMMARVVDIVPESPESKSYVLRPVSRWQGFEPGMHLQIGVEINGALVRRFYSVSSTPRQFQQDGTFSITVKRIPGGKVSNWLFEHLGRGALVQIGQASGDFQVNRTAADKVLMLAGGSGITPIKSMLATHLPAQPARDFQLLYYCRNPEEVIFGESLQALAECHPNFRFVRVHTDTDGLIDAEQLARLCPDVAERDVFLCGPGGFMQAAVALLNGAGVTPDRIFQEVFGVRAGPATTGAANQQAQVRFAKSGIESASQGGQTLLALAEAAGLNPKYGCRSGICHECKCRKASGRVLNLMTGQVSSEDDEMIQTCISVPQGNVEVML